jgi:misacylated tRNA(Ala) deacylase
MGETDMAETDILFMPDIEANYIQEWDAKVIKRKKDYVMLDRTAFYPEGGGQPTDSGKLVWDGGEIEITSVLKKGIVKHIVDGDPHTVPDQVRAELDWGKRHAHMRMHTAQHLISAVILELYGAHTVGNQLYADRSRIDFDRARMTDDDLQKVKVRFDELVDQAIPVRIYEMDREEMEKGVKVGRAQLDLLPKSVTRLRVVDIEGYDLCPCAGTHVRNLEELGHLVPLGRESKGAQKERVHFTLEDL